MKTKSSISIGDCVRLNSGGPPMTVTAMNGDRCNVMWFDSQNMPQHLLGYLKAVFRVVMNASRQGR